MYLYSCCGRETVWLDDAGSEEEDRSDRPTGDKHMKICDRQLEKSDDLTMQRASVKLVLDR